MAAPQVASYTTDFLGKAARALGGSAVAPSPRRRPAAARKPEAHRPKPQVAPGTERAPGVVTVNLHGLATALRQAAAFAGTDPTRPLLAMVCIEIGKAELHIASTDTYRLYHAALRAVTHPDDVGQRVLLSATTCRELAKAYGSDRRDVTVTVRAEGLQVGDSATVLAENPSGCYPDWQRFVPTGLYDNQCAVSVENLSAALKVALAIAKHDANRVSLDVDRDGLNVRAEFPQHVAEGHCIVTVPACDTAGAFSLACNGRYLLQYLDEMLAEYKATPDAYGRRRDASGLTVHLSSSSDIAPAYIVGARGAYVLMPMQRGC